MNQSWTRGLALLAFAMGPIAACSGGKSSSGQGHGPDASADVGTPDASASEEAAVSDAGPPDGAACPLLGQSSCSSFAPPQTPASSAETFDEALSYGCAHPLPAGFDAAPSYPCVY